MSVVDSREELEQAKARLADATEQQLAADISFWSVASLDASADYSAATELQVAAHSRYQRGPGVDDVDRQGDAITTRGPDRQADPHRELGGTHG